MILELLTPFALATAPVALDSSLNAGEYCHATQAVVGADPTIVQHKTITYNGTRTYDNQGKPFDNDGDSD